MKLTKVVVLTGFLGIMSAPVMAAEAEVEAPNFTDMDANADGGVDAAEFDKGKNAGVEKTFAEADADKNGKINEEEYGVIKEPDCD